VAESARAGQGVAEMTNFKIVECDALPEGTILLVSSPVTIPRCTTMDELVSYLVSNGLAATVRVAMEESPTPPQRGEGE
jgi:hypothetical protein